LICDPQINGAGLGFGSPNLNLNYSMMILTPEPPSNNTSFIVFFTICTWIITMRLSIATIVVPIFGTKELTYLSMVDLLRF
jgi:hypothetical protein